MAKKLGSDGRPIDVPTNPPQENERKESATSPKSRGRRPKVDLGEQPTVVLDRSKGSKGATTRPGLRFPSDTGRDRQANSADAATTKSRARGQGDEGETLVWGGARRPKRPGAAAESGHVHPVTGWLVVVQGPGKGQALQLGFGHNTIGRGPGMRVHLDFGDRKISRDTHAMLTYDPKGNAFYIQPGKNLTYVGGDPVLAPAPLEAGSLIALGDTTLRFVPFCDDAFVWDEAD